MREGGSEWGRGERERVGEGGRREGGKEGGDDYFSLFILFFSPMFFFCFFRIFFLNFFLICFFSFSLSVSHLFFPTLFFRIFFSSSSHRSLFVCL